MTAPPSIQNQLLDITVVGCSNLPQPWGGITANHPYINLLYGSEIFRTRICLDEFKIQLIEGIRKIKVEVMNSNSFGADNIIGYGKIYLHKVLHVGYDSKTWPLLSKSFRQAGELKVIMHYENVEVPGTCCQNKKKWIVVGKTSSIIAK
ncbi:Elicitor-responsive protein [Zostera marina]|uniref:Elicitor-responsive protein n=1 Tax=Zostera marina TaxID=29655 RepID=A0A0K9PBN0_ZOSMR|nr:Elicitor-responsive protein [Zostera marina]